MLKLLSIQSGARMNSTRKEVLQRLERFNRTEHTHINFSIFSKPTNPDSNIDANISSITSLHDPEQLDRLITEFNTMFAPCRIEYTRTTATTAGESNSTGYSQAEAMGILADEFDMTDEFNAACRAAVETGLHEPIYLFQEKLMKAFGENWALINKDACVTQVKELGWNDALESHDIDRLTEIMYSTVKPGMSAFWTRINELTGNKMDSDTLEGLTEQCAESGKKAARENIEHFLATNIIATRVVSL